MIKLQLELGGKDPDLRLRRRRRRSAAAESLADGALYNTGQSCCSVERIYVHETIYDAFVEAFVADGAAASSIGDPMDEATYIGAITRARAARRARGAGRRRAPRRARALLLGGTRDQAARATGSSRRCSPTSTTRWRVMRDESFGPIIGIQTVADDEAAVALMNDTRVRPDRRRVHARRRRARRRCCRSVNAGSVYWNCCDRVSPRLPWSGVKHSGIGLTLSTYGIQTFTRPKAWHLKSA